MDAGVSGMMLETSAVEAAGDLACGRGSYRLSVAPPGGPKTEDVGKYVVVYRRQSDGSWKAVADIFNSDQPAA